MKTKTLLALVYTGAVCLIGTSCSTVVPFSGKGDEIAKNAQSWDGKYYRRGQSRQCANWVSEVIKDSGLNPPPSSARAASWLSWGAEVELNATILPGDIIVYKNTYKRGPSHIAIVLDPATGLVIHRATYSAPVRTMDMRSKQIAGIRRADDVI